MLSLCFAAATLAPAVAMFFLSSGRDGSLPIWTTAVMVTGTSRLAIDRLLLTAPYARNHRHSGRLDVVPVRRDQAASTLPR